MTENSPLHFCPKDIINIEHCCLQIKKKILLFWSLGYKLVLNVLLSLILQTALLKVYFSLTTTKFGKGGKKVSSFPKICITTHC